MTRSGISAFLLRHRVLIKRAAFVAALCLFFYVIGLIAGPAPASGGLCRVYF
jgi:hypothetical protein